MQPLRVGMLSRGFDNLLGSLDIHAAFLTSLSFEVGSQYSPLRSPILVALVQLCGDSGLVILGGT